MSERLILIAAGLLALSGLPSLFLPRRAPIGQWIAAGLMAAGAGLGLVAVGNSWVSGVHSPIEINWWIPGSTFAIGIDGLSAWFLVPVLVMAAIGPIYGLEYWPQAEHPGNAPRLQFFYGTVAAGMVLLLIARDAVVFLFGWEVMALSGFFLIVTEDEDADVRATGWLYLACTHAATLCLFGAFGLLASGVGSFALEELPAGSLSAGGIAALFALAVAGAGFKAGLMPLHFWLPSAHANAPSHVSALFSGVIIKMGVYALIRIFSLVPGMAAWQGEILLALGAISGVLGIAFALGQHDLKRLLAYSSIENIGIIAMGIGLALMGRALGRPDWLVLGLCGALFHVWNHFLFKGLLFLNAGGVIHSAHTRAMDEMGDLAKRMPATSALFLVGALAICGLPPLNGFASEFLLYIGLFRTFGVGEGPSAAGAAYAAPALAMIGALAVACYVKAFGSIFLGVGRTDKVEHARESPPAMLAAMLVLAAGCAAIGLFPQAVLPALGGAATSWGVADAPAALAPLAPLSKVSLASMVLVGLLAAGAFALARFQRANGKAEGPTWGCGYAAPTRRMQYTASSFSDTLVGLFRWALRTREHPPAPFPLFPKSGDESYRSVPVDPVLDAGVRPAMRAGASFFERFRVLQAGSIHNYLMYIAAALLALLLWPW